MEKIFISYRRKDTQAAAVAIKEKIKQHLSNQYQVFMDTSSIEPGDIWPEKIEKAISDATIVLVIIGDKWLHSYDEYGLRRIDDEKDWVRLELKTAINKNKTIIPLLIDGTVMPTKSLPDDIKGVIRYQGVELRLANLDNDIEKLFEKLRTPQKKRATIIITSESPRRKALLKQIGWEEKIDYDTWPTAVKPNRKTAGISLDEAKSITEETARKKIRFVESDLPEIRHKKEKEFNRDETIILGVDTTVFCKNKLLDRPLIESIENATVEEIKDARPKAKKMLQEQRGQKINIITCVAVALANDIKKIEYKTVVTDAQLRNYSDEDIENYISNAEPFDKAGAFGIQEKGVSLFERIKGSYSNIVGLPLNECIDLLRKTFGKVFDFPQLRSTLRKDTIDKLPDLSTISIGDINYDFIYYYPEAGFFKKISSPGPKEKGEIYRGAGGTAVNFAKGANAAGFSSNYVVGVVGRDGLGRDIREELREEGITLLEDIENVDYTKKTSIALLLCDKAREDISIIVTDARQKLPANVVEATKETIEKSDVFYCSGYALTDENRRDYTQEMVELAKKSGCIVVFGVVGGMSKEKDFSTYPKFRNRMKTKNDKICVDILVSELKEILQWFEIDYMDGKELSAWETNKESIIGIIDQLRSDFPVTILWTSKYTHEIIITPNEVIGPKELEYNRLSAQDKLGYGEIRTASLVYEYLAPRVLLASKSPQRLDLLQQIIAPEKIQVQESKINEDRNDKQSPQERVIRLARAKARAVLDRGDFGDNIELIIGADTEIIGRQDDEGDWVEIGHPKSIERAIEDLKRLRGKLHKAITGIAVIGIKQGSDKLMEVYDCIETQVTFANLEDDQIESYANSQEPINRAGAYAIQGLGSLLIESIDGSYSNVVGLPLERLSEILAENFKKPIWFFDKVSNWTMPMSIKSARKYE